MVWICNLPNIVLAPVSVVVNFELGKLFAETVKFLDNDMHLAADRFVRSL